MKGKLYYLIKHNEKAVKVYYKNIHKDEKDRTKEYVLVWSEADKTSKRQYVKTGHKKGNYVEVLEGLKAGDEIVKTAL